MTSPSPTAVTYEYEADYWTGDTWTPLPVTLITPSVDANRVPYATAQLTLTAIDDEAFAALDPRTLPADTPGQVRWRTKQLDLAGNVLGYLPRAGANVNDYATMHVRTIRRTLESVTVDLSGGEALIDDKLCILKADGPGPVVPNRQLINWVLELVITRTRPDFHSPARVVAADDHARNILDGDFGWGKPYATTVKQGETYLSALETELNSYNVRLVDAWGLGWFAATRGLPPTYAGAPTTVKLGAYTSDALQTLPADVDPIVTSLEQVASRDGDWADAVVLSGEASDGVYVNRWQQVAGVGRYRTDLYAIPDEMQQVLDGHSRGRSLSIGRAAPSGNLAESIASRAVTRGHDLTVTARVRFDILPGMVLEVHLRTQILTATIVSVSWDLANGEMSIRAQFTTTAPPLSSASTSGSTLTGSAEAVAAVHQLKDELQPVVDSARRFDGLASGLRQRRRGDA